VIPGVVLAAGASSRMGRPKALLPVRSGESFLARIVATLRTAGVEDVVVVLGAEAETIAASPEVAALDARLIANPDHARGQLTSVIAALAVVDRPGVRAMLVTLVDVPLVSPATVEAVLETYRRTLAPVVRPAKGARHGHPVIFDRRLFGELRAADPAVGARAVVRAHAAEIVDVPVDDEGAFLDIDTPEDYERIIGRSCSGT
jgi:molybdenum cofactor cytidylyltransferase